MMNSDDDDSDDDDSDVDDSVDDDSDVDDSVDDYDEFAPFCPIDPPHQEHSPNGGEGADSAAQTLVQPLAREELEAGEDSANNFFAALSASTTQTAVAVPEPPAAGTTSNLALATFTSTAPASVNPVPVASASVVPPSDIAASIASSTDARVTLLQTNTNAFNCPDADAIAKTPNPDLTTNLSSGLLLGPTETHHAQNTKRQSPLSRTAARQRKKQELLSRVPFGGDVSHLLSCGVHRAFLVAAKRLGRARAGGACTSVNHLFTMSGKEAPFADALRQGWMVKSPPSSANGQYKKRWKKRYFVMDDEQLAYYKKKNPTTLKGSIPLTDIKDVVPEEQSKLQHVFAVYTTDRVYFMQAASEIDRQGWMRDINRLSPSLGRAKRSSNPIQRSFRHVRVSHGSSDDEDTQPIASTDLTVPALYLGRRVEITTDVAGRSLIIKYLDGTKELFAHWPVALLREFGPRADTIAQAGPLRHSYDKIGKPTAHMNKHGRYSDLVFMTDSAHREIAEGQQRTLAYQQHKAAQNTVAPKKGHVAYSDIDFEKTSALLSATASPPTNQSSASSRNAKKQTRWDVSEDQRSALSAASHRSRARVDSRIINPTDEVDTARMDAEIDDLLGQLDAVDREADGGATALIATLTRPCPLFASGHCVPFCFASLLSTYSFNLLLLDHNDQYFEDYTVQTTLRNRPVDGRLKVCANAFVFEPKDFILPLVKVAYRHVTRLKPWRDDDAQGDTYNVSHLLPAADPYTQQLTLRFPSFAAPHRFYRDRHPICRSQLQDAWQRDTHLETMAIIEQVIEEHRAKVVFNASWLRELSEEIAIEMQADRILPLTRNAGRAVLTNKRLYFQPFNNVDPDPVVRFNLSDVHSVVRRRFLLRDVGLELLMSRHTSLYLAFESKMMRERFLTTLIRQPALKLEVNDKGNMMVAWQNGKISNFDYLMYLNSQSDRSFNDLAQYPVFPWILADYESPELDLNDPQTFRDLSKPMGAMTESRLQDYMNRYEEMPEPKYFYGTHYSTPGYVLFFTLRVASEYSLNLQNGKFDRADRLFRSIRDTWWNATHGMADVKELIPEFYMDDVAFLRNLDNLDFGVTQRGERVDDVLLPPWAHNAEDFLAKCRAALESDYVSAHLHHWIDLIFGYKQRGSEARKACNVFHPMTYEGEVDLDSVQDPIERQAYEVPPHAFLPSILAAKSLVSFSMVSSLVCGPRIFELKVHATWRAPPRSKLWSLDKHRDSSSPPRMVNAEPSEVIEASEVETAPVTAVDVTSTGTKRAPVNWSSMADMESSVRLQIHRDAITAVVLSADGSKLYSGTSEGCMRIHSLLDQQQLHTANIGVAKIAHMLLFEEQQMLVVGSMDNSVYFYSIEHYYVSTTWTPHNDSISCLGVAAERLFTSSWDGTIKAWRLPTDITQDRIEDDCLAVMEDHDTEVACFDVHEGRDILVSAGMDGIIIIWDLNHYSPLQRFTVHPDVEVSSLALTPDGKRVVTTSWDGFLKATDVDSGVEHAVIDMGEEEISAMATDGELALVASEQGMLRLYSLVSRELVRKFPHSEPVASLVVSLDGQHVVT
ncbi:uncharacterized protein MONBRDRAFT_38432, partial [Monosiga brevicollis MX1]